MPVTFDTTSLMMSLVCSLLCRCYLGEGESLEVDVVTFNILAVDVVLFPKEGDVAVAVENHCGVARRDVADLVVAVP